MPKPVLSDLEYNASDVASAILSQADLSVTNEDLGVSSVTNLLSNEVSGLSISNEIVYSFNGFIFISMTFDIGSPSDPTTLAEINSDYTPNENTYFPVVGYGGDTANHLVFKTNNDLVLSGPDNVGSSHYFATINGWYRYT